MAVERNLHAKENRPLPVKRRDDNVDPVFLMLVLLLLAVGVIEFLFITQESRFSGIGYYLAETYVVVPCLLAAAFSAAVGPVRGFSSRFTGTTGSGLLTGSGLAAGLLGPCVSCGSSLSLHATSIVSIMAITNRSANNFFIFPP